jgi:hypothetical protein
LHGTGTQPKADGERYRIRVVERVHVVPVVPVVLWMKSFVQVVTNKGLHPSHRHARSRHVKHLELGQEEALMLHLQIKPK